MAYAYQTFDKKTDRPHKKWRFQYTNWKGERKTATGKTTKSATLDLGTRIEVEHDEIRKGFRAPPKPSEKYRFRSFADVAHEYLEWGRAQGGRNGHPWGKEHVRKRESQLHWWIKKLKLEVLIDVDAILPEVEKTLQTLQKSGRTGKTLTNYGDTLKGFCSWCVTRKYLDENPLQDLSAFDTTPQTIRRALSSEEIHKILEVAPLHRRLLYETAFCSGLRASELKALQVDDLDPELNGLQLRPQWTKNRKVGFQPLPKKLVQNLLNFAQTDAVTNLYRKYSKNGFIKENGLGEPLLYVTTHPARSLYTDLQKAGIPKSTKKGKVDFHACRTAYITHLLNSGAKVKEAQSLARHSDPKLTMNVYARTSDERLASIAEAIGDSILQDENIIGTEQEKPDSAINCSSEGYNALIRGFDSPRLHQFKILVIKELQIFKNLNCANIML